MKRGNLVMLSLICFAVGAWAVNPWLFVAGLVVPFLPTGQKRIVTQKAAPVLPDKEIIELHAAMLVKLTVVLYRLDSIRESDPDLHDMMYAAAEDTINSATTAMKLLAVQRPDLYQVVVERARQMLTNKS